MNTESTYIISPEVAAITRAQYDRHNAWLKSTGKNSYKPEEVPQGCEYPGTEATSALEVYEFCRDRPESYFLYINESKSLAITWAGDELGIVTFGRSYRGNMGDVRVPVTIHAINGKRYHGTYFNSAGNYARVKMCKDKPKPDSRIGKHVEISPAYDLWMRGARFGTIRKIVGNVAHVKMDHPSVKRLARVNDFTILEG